MKNIKQGIIFGLVFSTTVLFSFLAYGAWSDIPTVEVNDNLSANKWNQLVNNINTIGAQVNTLSIIPIGFIGAFNLTTCPAGWLPADGTNETPDLRGQFIRGLNTFDDGVSIRNDGKQDPNNRALGNYQADEIKSHNHNMRWGNSPSNNTDAANFAGAYNNWDPLKYKITGDAGGLETRPRNIALLYCMKN